MTYSRPIELRGPRLSALIINTIRLGISLRFSRSTSSCVYWTILSWQNPSLSAPRQGSQDTRSKICLINDAVKIHPAKTEAYQEICNSLLFLDVKAQCSQGYNEIAGYAVLVYIQTKILGLVHVRHTQCILHIPCSIQKGFAFGRTGITRNPYVPKWVERIAGAVAQYTPLLCHKCGRSSLFSNRCWTYSFSSFFWHPDRIEPQALSHYRIIPMTDYAILQT